MVVVVDNVNDIPLYAYTSEEPLFLKPDGVRTRYPIGWNGYGRYIPGTLKVTYNGLPCEISEENNGIFYNFSVAPGANTKYDDYRVSFSVRPVDYAFCTGAVEGGFPGEEYFLFPNWNNAAGEGYGFWIGKYPMSLDSNGMPVSVANATEYYGNEIFSNIANYIYTNNRKSERVHLIYNREYVSIALWTDHMGIDVKGNIYGNNPNDLDGENTKLIDVGSYYTFDGYNIITGPGPDSWNHNGLSTGIHHLVGNFSEWVEAICLKRSNKSSYTFDIRIYDNTYNIEYSSGYSYTMPNTGIECLQLVFDGIIQDDNDIINEGIPTKNSENTYYTPSNFNNSQTFYIPKPSMNTDLYIFLARGGNCGILNYQGNTNIWSVDQIRFSDKDPMYGTRLAFDLV